MAAPTDSPDDLARKVCFCHDVNRGELIRAIEEGARSLPEIQARTLASTGCGGCECEVQELLEEVLARLVASRAL